jgi:hypothetical protein
MAERPYRFRSRFPVHGSMSDTFQILAALACYPEWWPEIRSVHALDGRRAAVSIRSLLPYTLRVELIRTVED